MTVTVKICGLNDAASVAAAAEAGAQFAGFVFYRKSPRLVTAEQAAGLIAPLPPHLTPVGLFVDAGDDELTAALRIAPLRMLQLHGNETPERVAAVKKLTGLPVIKAVGIAAAADIDVAKSFQPVGDYLLLDAKPASGDLPGGNARSFEWGLLQNISLTLPWLLAGGLNADNVADAVRISGARIVDVSSGVEDAPGHKNPAKIKAFIVKAQQIETCC